MALYRAYAGQLILNGKSFFGSVASITAVNSFWIVKVIPEQKRLGRKWQRPKVRY
jgi:hypothetical protein